jgi:hypothetical protein
MMVESYRFFFQNGMYDLMQRLDSQTSPSGKTVLDQSLMFWTHESGHQTHSSMDLPVVTAGGAGGGLNTGRYVDYRNMNRRLYAGGPTLMGYQGMPYNRFLGTVLQAMGVPPSVYELPASLFASSVTGRIPTTSRGTVPGYGHPFQGHWGLNVWDDPRVYPWDYMLDDMSVPLPGLS